MMSEPMATCNTCGAVVTDSMQDKHLGWHRKIDAAIAALDNRLVQSEQGTRC